VLRAIGCDAALARGTLRLSFGAELTLDAADRAARIVARCVAEARRTRDARVGHAA
jgi:cysteine sulfinate desulfinase/cysteine desulfurase-like protein